MADGTMHARVAALRRFNRFYTRLIGALDEGHLHSEFSLTEARVLFELAHRDAPTARDLAADLGLDAGYLSRLLQRLARRRLLVQRPSPDDARRRLLTLTAAGRRAYARLDERATADVATLLSRLPPERQDRVVAAMHEIADALAPTDEPRGPYVLRPQQPGDIGWVVQAHAQVYAEEYGWDQRFEAMVARIGARFVERFDPARERCWIAERDGVRLGCVFLVRRSASVAQLRMLLVTRAARNAGLGRKLVAECERFARQAGYRKIVLWTNQILDAARHLYVEAGYTLVKEEREQAFGHDLVFETWEKALAPVTASPRPSRRASAAAPR